MGMYRRCVIRLCAVATSSSEAVRDRALREKIERLQTDPRFASTVVDDFEAQRRSKEHDAADQQHKARIEHIRMCLDPRLFNELSARADAYRAKSLEEARKLDGMTPLEMFNFQALEKAREERRSSFKMVFWVIINAISVFLMTFWWWGFW